MGARCITSVWIGYHVAELAVIRLGQQNRGLIKQVMMDLILQIRNASLLSQIKIHR